jgi:hypothetical protein
MRIQHSGETINRVIALVESGMSHRQASDATGVPLNTLRLWLYRRVPERALNPVRCESCGAREHDFAALPPHEYAYLLGAYLGDGSIFHHAAGVFGLRITLDTAYPGIIEECRTATTVVRDGRPAHVARVWDGRNCVNVCAYWKQWPCYFPQHGPGRKHNRPIVLEPWQQAHVDAAPEMFLRALIHTDGWRGLNKVTVKGRDYAYPRYQFSNRSDDIRKLFTDTCDSLGIEWRRWGRWHISVAKRASVARMDEFVGLKA